jgi:hypothetical protein
VIIDDPRDGYCLKTVLTHLHIEYKGKEWDKYTMVEQIKIMDACTILGGAEGQLHAVLLRSNSISTEVTKRLYSEGGLIIAGPRRRNKKNSPPVNGSWAPF